MGIYTLMQKVGAVYYYRQVVPNDLRLSVGKNEIKQSLKTKDYKLAISRNKAKAIEIEAWFKTLRNGEAVPIIATQYPSENNDNSVAPIPC